MVGASHGACTACIPTKPCYTGRFQKVFEKYTFHNDNKAKH